MASNSANLAALPSPRSITLLLKNNKSTTLLSALPTSTFDDVKSLLIAALKSRNVPKIPDSPAALELAVLANPRDASKGWVPIHLRVQELAAGKNAKKAASGKKSALDGSVEGAGLVDGSWVAWRVKSSATKDECMSTDEAGDEMALDIDEEKDPGWDVMIPKYEDEEEEEA
jgi:hypothetical protein